MRRVFLMVLAAAALLAGVAVVRTAAFTSSQTVVAPAPAVAIRPGAAERLAGSLRIRTISHDDSSLFEPEAFRAFHDYLHDAFPVVHSRLRRETVGTHSLLYTWPGSDTSLKPILLMGHLDVVPVEPGTEHKWQEHPYEGRVAEGFIWGRGAIDNKSAVLGTLEAAEMLLSEGFSPVRTIYLAYGHDEEVGGKRGANAIAELLDARGVKLELVMDEGGVIGDGVMPGITAPIAMIGVAEKGFVSVELSTRTAGGHSSLPPPQSAVGILSRAIARLEDNPMPARLDGATRLLFDRVGPRFRLSQRAAFANLWLTQPLVIRSLTASPTTNAMVRTTAAPTVFQAGEKDNVLPSYARAIVNFRIRPGDSVAGVLEHVRRTIADTTVQARVAGNFVAEPSSTASTEAQSFQTLERAIRKVVPDAVVAPYLVVVVTDSRYFGALSHNILRFLPLRLTSSDLDRIHGINERVAVDNYETAIRVYRELIKDASQS